MRPLFKQETISGCPECHYYIYVYVYSWNFDCFVVARLNEKDSNFNLPLNVTVFHLRGNFAVVQKMFFFL